MSREQKRYLVLAVVLAVVAASVGVLLGRFLGGSEPSERAGNKTPGPAPTNAQPEELAEIFASDRPLGRFRTAARDFEAIGASDDTTAGCDRFAEEFDMIGSVEEIFDEAVQVPDASAAEAALEQHAAVSSMMAACRGDAPITISEAASELTMSNDGLDAVLSDLGVG